MTDLERAIQEDRDEAYPTARVYRYRVTGELVALSEDEATRELASRLDDARIRARITSCRYLSDFYPRRRPHPAEGDSQ